MYTVNKYKFTIKLIKEVRYSKKLTQGPSNLAVI